MPTIRDVATRAGVAPTTVSRVINRSGPVGEETRRRVEAAIEELGYVPNRLATSLRSNRTHMVALVLSTIGDAFCGQMISGVEAVLSEHGYYMILCNVNRNRIKEKDAIDGLAERRVDGLIMLPVKNDSRPVRMAQRYGIPVVVLDQAMPDVKVDVVRGDSMGGANQLTKLLLDLGHRRIAVLSGPPYSSTATMRVDGYRQALEAAGITPEPELIQFGEYSLESGYRMTERALSLAPRPTALLAANNSIAYGMLKALRDAKLRVPEDISVVGYAYLPVETTEHLFLTVAEQSPSDIGRRAAEILLARLSGQQLPPQEIILPIKVVFRESCKPLSNS